MDIPALKNVPLLSAALAGQNGHVRAMDIVQTLEADRAHRRANRDQRKRFPGEGHSYPVGHMRPLGQGRKA